MGPLPRARVAGDRRSAANRAALSLGERADRRPPAARFLHPDSGVLPLVATLAVRRGPLRPQHVTSATPGIAQPSRGASLTAPGTSPEGATSRSSIPDRWR